MWLPLGLSISHKILCKVWLPLGRSISHKILCKVWLSLGLSISHKILCKVWLPLGLSISHKILCKVWLPLGLPISHKILCKVWLPLGLYISHMIGSLKYGITLKLDMPISSTAAEVPVNCWSNLTIMNKNLRASTLCKILQYDLSLDIETGAWALWQISPGMYCYRNHPINY